MKYNLNQSIFLVHRSCFGPLTLYHCMPQKGLTLLVKFWVFYLITGLLVTPLLDNNTT